MNLDCKFSGPSINISLALFVVILTSCASTKSNSKSDNFEEVKLFAGTYQTFQKGQYYSIPTLGYCLTYSVRLTGGALVMDSINGSRLKVLLIPKNSRTIKVRIEQDGKVFKRKTIKGYYDNGYFNYTIRDIAPLILINSFIRQDNRMKLLENGDLSVDMELTNHLYLLFFRSAWGHGGSDANMIFKRINN